MYLYIQLKYLNKILITKVSYFFSVEAEHRIFDILVQIDTEAFS